MSGTPNLPAHAIAAGDQAASALTNASYQLVSDRLAEVGLSLDDLSEDECEVLSIGINCGIEAAITSRPTR